MEANLVNGSRLQTSDESTPIVHLSMVHVTAPPIMRRLFFTEDNLVESI
jgi:hypothetical protein